MAATHNIKVSRVSEVIEMTGMAGVATKRVGGFSLGMGQRLPGVWLQISIETSRRLIGDIPVRVDGDETRQATVGFTLAAEAQGHGYATEALRTVISLLFLEHDVHRICADC